MAKIIRFPLEMADGGKVRDLEELREHFDLETVVSYYKSGKLLTWLKSRYFEDEAAAVEALDEDAPDFQSQLCGIFGVKFAGNAVDLEAVAQRQERLKKLREFTDEKEFIDHIDQVAFNQEELADLIDAGTPQIYLCGKYFVIPAQYDHVTYIGIDQPTVHISGLEKGKSFPNGIHLQQAKLDNPPGPVDVEFTCTAAGLELPYDRKGFRTIQIVLKEPVLVDGVKYDHIPALSADIFEKLDLAEGDLVRVHRVGDVIPSITVEKRNGGKKIELPKTCPTCGKPMRFVAKKLKCVDVDCPDNLAGRLLGFWDYAGMKDLGEATAKRLVENGIDMTSIFEYGEEGVAPYLMTKAGFSEDEANSLYDRMIAAAKDMWDYEFIGCCGMPGIGKETAKKIFAKYADTNYGGIWLSGPIYEAVYHKVMDEHAKNCEGLSVKERMDSKIPCEYFSGMFYAAEKHCKRSTPEHFANLKSVGHTGGDPSDAVKTLIRELGWDLVDGKKFDYLIVPSYQHESSKTKAAKEKDCKMFTAEDFIKEFKKAE